MRFLSSKVLVRIGFSFVLLFAFSARSSDRMLLKITKGEQLQAADALAEIPVIQELDSCWIVQASSEQYLALRELGIECEILEPSPAEKSCYLLLGISPDQIRPIESLGHVMAIEEGIWLYCDPQELFWDLLPAQAHVKLLGEPTVQRITSAGEEPGEVRAQEEAPADPLIVQMVGELARDNLSSTIQELQNFQTRRAPTANLEEAGTYIYDFFSKRGIPVAYDEFSFTVQGSTYFTRNIVATIQGKTSPEQIVIVGAHYDSTSNQAFTLAPGADDNASGSTAVMELARIMTNYSFARTLRFICFSAEELGLLGSRHYALEAAQKGETIRGMIDLDMIGYVGKTGEDLDLITNSASEWLADLFLSCTRAYTTLPVLKSIRPSATGSDHSSFWDRGYSAVMGIEAYPLVNPYYHRTTDTLDTLNMDFAASVSRAALATAATLAQPVSTLPAPTNLTARSGITRSLFSKFKKVTVTWESVDPTVVGYHVYRAATPNGNYQRINAVPVTAKEFVDRYLDPGKSYYYVVTAVDGQGRESSYSAEVRDGQNN